MSMTQKTTLKRYNGTDWDPVYLANSADITYLGVGFKIAESTEDFTIGDNVAASESTASLMQKIVNNLATVTGKKLPALADGTGITALPASKLTGKVARTNLPDDIGGKGIEVATEEARQALTMNEVNIGDLVKVTGGKVYTVTGADTEGVTYMELTDSASDIAWARIANKPTTLTGYGITDAVAADEKVTEAKPENAGKILVLNADGKLPASITGDAATLGGKAADTFATAAALAEEVEKHKTTSETVTQLGTDLRAIDAAWITKGTISIDRLPATAIERLHVVATPETLATVTSAQAQNGDSLKVTSTGKMYFVIDDTKLGTTDYMDGLTEYTAGIAGAVDWSGVQNKPTTLNGYGITDALAAADKATTGGAANAGKVATLNEAGKLAMDITGDAATLGGHGADYFATKEAHDTASGKITTLETDVANLKTALGEGESGSEGLVSSVNTLKSDMTTAKSDISALKAGTAITALAASKLTGTVARANLPADISGRLFTKATMAEAQTSLTADNAAVGDLVKLANGQVYVVTDTANLDNDGGYTVIVDVANTSISWNKLTDIPTTLAAMNWSDAVTTAMITDTGSVANAGKLVKLSDDGKLHADITGDAATLGGNAPAYYATADALTSLTGRMTTAEGKVATLETDIKAIDAAWITKGTISIDRLPHGALERCVVVATDTARMALTIDDVQAGDTVKVTGTGLMYFVVDADKLGTEDAFEVYTAGTASAVDWSGVQNKPTTLTGYGITDAVAANEKVSVASAANAGKILVLNGDGKLDVDITGSVAWDKITGKPTSTVTAIDQAVTASVHTNRAVLDLLTADG
ncbi:hypothetical protein, partial [uncultured Duncaniella sp.]|uniref:hypothetical protein n=1 Tax=uncultured Duncaniella sp. TaxID=2768039 RepID=UPI00261323CF